MTLNELINIADAAYPLPGIIGLYHTYGSGDFGDTLAEFIATELASAFNPNASTAEQLAAAITTMETAIDDLRVVAGALRVAASKVTP